MSGGTIFTGPGGHNSRDTVTLKGGDAFKKALRAKLSFPLAFRIFRWAFVLRVTPCCFSISAGAGVVLVWCYRGFHGLGVGGRACSYGCGFLCAAADGSREARFACSFQNVLLLVHRFSLADLLLGALQS